MRMLSPVGDGEVDGEGEGAGAAAGDGEGEGHGHELCCRSVLTLLVLSGLVPPLSMV